MKQKCCFATTELFLDNKELIIIPNYTFQFDPLLVCIESAECQDKVNASFYRRVFCALCIPRVRGSLMFFCFFLAKQGSSNTSLIDKLEICLMVSV